MESQYATTSSTAASTTTASAMHNQKCRSMRMGRRIWSKVDSIGSATPTSLEIQSSAYGCHCTQVSLAHMHWPTYEEQLDATGLSVSTSRDKRGSSYDISSPASGSDVDSTMPIISHQGQVLFDPASNVDWSTLYDQWLTTPVTTGAYCPEQTTPLNTFAIVGSAMYSTPSGHGTWKIDYSSTL